MKNSSRLRNPQLYGFLILAIVLFLLGIAGFARYAAWHNLPLTPLDWVYLTFQLIPLNSGAVEPPVPLELEAARFLLPLLAAAAAVQAFLEFPVSKSIHYSFPGCADTSSFAVSAEKAFCLPDNSAGRAEKWW